MTIGAPNAGTPFAFATPATSSDIAFPPVTTAGAVLFAFVSVNVVGLTTNPDPTHWTTIASFSGTGGTLLPSVFAAWKVADGTEGGTTLHVVHPSGKAFGLIVELAGVDTTTPLDVAVSTEDSSAGGGNQDCVIPGVTTVTAGCSLFTFAASNGTGGQTATPPTGFTELADGGGTAEGEVAILQGVSAGATGSATVHFSGAGKQVGMLFAVRPAAPTSKSAAETGGGTATATVAIGLTAADTAHGAEAAAVTVAPDVTRPAGTELDDPRKLYRLYLLNSSRQVVARIAQWITLSVALNFNDVSSVIFTAPAEVLGALAIGGGVLLKRNNVTLVHGPITAVIDQRDVGNPNGLITVGARSDEIALADRVCFPDPTLAFGSQTSGAKDTQTGVAETVIKHYVNLNAGPGAIVARRTSGLTVQGDAAHGTSGTWSAQFDELLTKLQEIATKDGLGFRIGVTGTTGREFQVFVPSDLSAKVRFALKLRNLTSLTVEEDAPTATRELYGGGTAAGTKAFTETGDTGSEASWGRRIEVYKTNPDSTSLTVLGQNGAADLKTDGPSQQITFAPFDTENATFGIHYNLGDKVTVITSAGEVADVLRAATFDFAGDGPEQMSLTIGPDGTSAIPASFRAIRRLEDSIRNIATRR